MMLKKAKKILLGGQSIFEVVFAVGISALILLAIVALTTSSISTSSLARNNTLATQYANDSLEWIRGERDRNWTDFIANVESGSASGYHFCFIESPLTNSTPGSAGTGSWANHAVCTTSQPIVQNSVTTIFYRNVVISCYQAPNTLLASCGDPAVDLVEADVTVTWSDSKGTHNAESKGSYTNWRR